MAKKRKNFIREKRIYCGEEYLEVDIVAVTNMPEAGKGKKGKSSQAQKNLNDKRSKRRFVQIANTNFGTRKLHTMYIDSAAIITIASVLGALTAIGAVAYKIIKWFQAQEKQTTDIEDLKKQEKEDIKAMEDELCLLTYAVLACLKGLKEQGCNGPVTEAIGKIEKHINQKAHGQET